MRDYLLDRQSHIKKIYICSPYRAKDQAEIEHNAQKAAEFCRFVIDTMPDTLPVAPHIYLTQFMDDGTPEERSRALAIDRELIAECKEVWVFGDRISDGMATEISAAADLGVPIRWFTRECKERAREAAEQ